MKLKMAKLIDTEKWTSAPEEARIWRNSKMTGKCR